MIGSRQGHIASLCRKNESYVKSFCWILPVLLVANALRLASFSQDLRAIAHLQLVRTVQKDSDSRTESAPVFEDSSASYVYDSLQQQPDPYPEKAPIPSNKYPIVPIASASKTPHLFTNERVNAIKTNIPLLMNSSDPRPRHLRLVIMGDSISRYQYISLAHFLKTGQWITDNTTFTNHSLNGNDTAMPLYCRKPGIASRQEFYRNSNAMLRPNEACDCRAYSENRYFVDAKRGNYLTYITKFGKNATCGRWKPGQVHQKNKTNVLAAKKTPRDAWNYQYWNETIVHHIAKLRPKPDFLLFNAGLHPHDLGDPMVREAIAQASLDHGILPIYKTTTYPNNRSVALGQFPLTRHDETLCGSSTIPFCLDLSWTADLYGPEHYYDYYHLKPYWNQFLNQQTLLYIQSIVRENVPPAIFTSAEYGNLLHHYSMFWH